MGKTKNRSNKKKTYRKKLKLNTKRKYKARIQKKKSKSKNKNKSKNRKNRKLKKGGQALTDPRPISGTLETLFYPIKMSYNNLRGNYIYESNNPDVSKGQFNPNH
tara:strand:+ start:6248 stop:6562 length:315 start_codon:yes stop_codon:yes gene_type:complete